MAVNISIINSYSNLEVFLDLDLQTQFCEMLPTQKSGQQKLILRTSIALSDFKESCPISWLQNINIMNFCLSIECSCFKEESFVSWSRYLTFYFSVFFLVTIDIKA